MPRQLRSSSKGKRGCRFGWFDLELVTDADASGAELVRIKRRKGWPRAHEARFAALPRAQDSPAQQEASKNESPRERPSLRRHVQPHPAGMHAVQRGRQVRELSAAKTWRCSWQKQARTKRMPRRRSLDLAVAPRSHAWTRACVSSSSTCFETYMQDIWQCQCLRFVRFVLFTRVVGHSRIHFMFCVLCFCIAVGRPVLHRGVFEVSRSLLPELYAGLQRLEEEEARRQQDEPSVNADSAPAPAASRPSLTQARAPSVLRRLAFGMQRCVAKSNGEMAYQLLFQQEQLQRAQHVLPLHPLHHHEVSPWLWKQLPWPHLTCG